jgi:type I restriction enzyme, S subunit
VKLEIFFKEFDQFADAHDAVAKMRELVLDLAAKGRLLPRRSNWETHPLKALATKIGSGATPAGGRESYFGEGVPLIRSMNVYFRGFQRTGLVFLSDEQANELSNVTVQANDVLLNITGASIGRVTIAPVEMAGARVNQHVTIIRPTPELVPRFLAIFLASPSVQRMIDEIQVGATRQALTKGMIERFDIPLPTLDEQKRIVAKVDELMALCDRLEAQQQDRETRHAALARASLTRFAEAPTVANLPFLFHPSYAISPADLRKSILTLAVQGKLVSQDPKDEPASNLISKCAEEKSRLVAARIIKEKEEAEPITYNELPFEVPTGWEWVRLSSITRRIHYGYTASAKADLKAVRLLRITDIQKNSVQWSSVPGCDIAQEDVAQYQLEHGDILVARTGGTVGKSYLVQEVPLVAIFASYLIRIQGCTSIFDRYLKLFLESPTYWVQLVEGARGAAQPNVNGQTLGRMVISVPPFAEQRRIVAKVEQLMALVDELEAQLTASCATAANLLSAIVAELTGTLRSGRATVFSASGKERRGRPKKSLREKTQASL